MDFDAHKNTDYTVALLANAETSIVAGEDKRIAASIIEKAHDSLCSMTPTERMATLNIMRGLQAEPLVASEKKAEAALDSFQTIQTAWVNATVPKDQQVQMPLTKWTEPDYKAFNVREDIPGTETALTFRWRSKEPKVVVPLECDKK